MNLNTIRSRAAYFVGITAAGLTVAVTLTERLLQGQFGVATLISALGLGALGITSVLARTSAAFRYLAVSVLMTQIMALLVAAAGYPWQTDIHMAFFAGLAICALLYDIRAIILGAALIAVHHLVLGMAVSDLVYYGGSGVGRFAIHAGILVLETLALLWMTQNTLQMVTFANGKSAQAEANASEVSRLSDQMQLASTDHQRQRDETLSQLRGSFEHVVNAAAQGDFSQRIDATMADGELGSLARSVNTLVETVDQGLAETGTVLAAMAAADLTRRMNGTYQGAFAALAGDINAVADKMAAVVSQLRGTSTSLKDATGEILSGTNDLAERSTRQAATIEETTSSMDQLASHVLDNAGKARQASTVAASVTGTAEESGAVMREATQAMERITQSSAKISNIIGLIDDIAFQTNLLALNASVEAARAGDAGNGFAVVAVEVRRLAQSAAKASSDIKVLIELSASEVSGGSRLVSDAAAKLDTMLVAARTSNALMGDIARDSSSQAAAIEQMRDAVRTLDQMTQHNAALVEQINAAIEQTDGQAQELDRIVDVFALEPSAPVVQAPVTPPKPKARAAMPPSLKTTAKSYLSAGNTVLKDWEEF